MMINQPAQNEYQSVGQGYTAIDELVNARLDQIAEELEEEKIMHER